jgi:hypothetical protein
MVTRHGTERVGRASDSVTRVNYLGAGKGAPRVRRGGRRCGRLANGAPFGETILRYLDMHTRGSPARGRSELELRSLRLTRRLGLQDAGELIAIQSGGPVTYRVLRRLPRRDGM